MTDVVYLENTVAHHAVREEVTSSAPDCFNGPCLAAVAEPQAAQVGTMEQSTSAAATS